MLVELPLTDFEKFFPQGATEPIPKSPYMSRTDWRALARVCKFFNPKRILEIGTAWGDTTLWLAKNSPEARIVTVDVSKEMKVDSIHPDEIKPEAEIGRAYMTAEEDDKYALDVIDRVTLILQDSLKLSLREEDLKPFPFDMIVIDGAHDYEHVRHDTQTALRVVNKKKGIIVWHDVTTEQGVIRTLQEIPQAVLHVDRTYLAYTVFSEVE